MRDAKLGKPSSNKGKPKSDEHKRRISESLKGKPKSDEFKAKVRETLKSKVLKS